jgi:hypothetical protein
MERPAAPPKRLARLTPATRNGYETDDETETDKHDHHPQTMPPGAIRPVILPDKLAEIAARYCVVGTHGREESNPNHLNPIH